MDKPRICEVLGVAPGEEFEIDGVAYVVENGRLLHQICGKWGAVASDVIQAINNPDLVERKPGNSREAYLLELFQRSTPEAQEMVLRALGGDV